MAPRLTHCFGGSLSGLRRAAAVALVATVALAAGGAQARTSQPEDTGNSPSSISVNELPREAVGTLSLIAAGGPFPYEKDGVVFGNFERILPPQRRGYYHEYTVPTPGAHNRGAKRIVCGGPRKRTDNCYYSDDHYASFRRIID
ncbi:ribonuclease domain-containing protein [Paraburkholderia nodosa]|uniref:ribonuclease domain-containing protein n=1 Tax=Paraburkholderia nodosa TaxID=392320 RepID=UPI0004B1088C